MDETLRVTRGAPGAFGAVMSLLQRVGAKAPWATAAGESVSDTNAVVCDAVITNLPRISESEQQIGSIFIKRGKSS